MSTERYEIGLKACKQVVGDAYVDRAVLDEDGIEVGGGA